MCETPASHAGERLRERLGVDLVGEAQPFTQGSGQVEQRGETSCLPTDYSSQQGEPESSWTQGGSEWKAAQALLYLIRGFLMIYR